MNIDLFVVCCVITVRILIQHFIPYMADYLVKPVSDQLFIKENCGIFLVMVLIFYSFFLVDDCLEFVKNIEIWWSF